MFGRSNLGIAEKNDLMFQQRVLDSILSGFVDRLGKIDALNDAANGWRYFFYVKHGCYPRFIKFFTLLTR